MTEDLDPKILVALLTAEFPLNFSQIRQVVGGSEGEVKNVLYNLEGRGQIRADRPLIRRNITEDHVRFSLTELGQRAAEQSN